MLSPQPFTNNSEFETSSASNMGDTIQFADVEFRSESTTEVNLEVLHPENPLMIRFQKALKQQLENKLENIRDRVAQTEGEIKKIRSESDSVSEILFVQKCEVGKMEKMLYEYNETVSNLIATKEHMRNELESLKKVYENVKTKLHNENKLNIEFQRKVNMQRHVLRELQNYDRMRVSSLFVKRNSVMKNKSDKEAKLREKDKQDYVLMRLENEIFKFELLIRDCENQLVAKCEERTVLREKLSAKNFEFTDLAEGNSRLLKLWKNVVFLVSDRDEKCARLKVEFENHEISHKTKMAKLKSYKRDANEEIFRNEVVVANRNKKQKILNQLKQEHCNYLQKEKTIENELLEIFDMIEGTRKSMNLTLEEYALHKHSLSLMEVRLKNFSLKKTELEGCILSQLHNELFSSNISTKLNDEICKLRDTIAQQEMIVKELQTNYTNKLGYLEKQKILLNADHELLRNTKVEIDSLNEIIFDSEEKVNKLKLQIKQQNYVLDLERKRLCDLEKQPVQDSELPEKLRSITRQIWEINETIESEKRIWIRKQNEAVMMIEKKSKLTIELNSVRSHVYILQQKLSRLNQDITRAEKEHHDFDKSIPRMLRRISSLNNEYSNQKESENVMDNKTCTMQNVVYEKLKLAEIDSAQLVSEIGKLDERKETLGEELLNSERENLEWQKKVQLVLEMKDSIAKEISESGDIGAMRNEIHRMEIRYAQLKRAQDSLVCDLESSVHKRDRIINTTVTKEKIPKDDVAARSQRLMIQKIDMIENKNKTLRKKIEKCQNEYTNSCADKCRIVTEISERELAVNKLQDSILELEDKIFEYFALKQKNLEILIRKQRLADFLGRVKTNKVKYSLPNEFVTEKTFAKHRYMQGDLNEILETLQRHFPDLNTHIIRIINVVNSLSEL